MKLLSVPILVSQESRQEYFTLVTMQMLAITTGVFLGLVTAGYLFGYYDASPFPYFLTLQVMSIAGWWLTKIGHWRWVNFLPPLFFFALGAFGTYLSGIESAFILFYVVAFLLVGMLINTKLMFYVMLLGALIQYLMARFLHHTPILDLIPMIIIVLAACTGIALLQWLAKSVMDHALAQSFLDPLTGVNNRGYFEGMLGHFQGRHQYLYPISVLMADIDGLKQVNDAFGHAAGDELIVRAADSLRKACRKEDVLCRIGGDEFVVLLPRTDSITASVVATQLAELIEQDAPPHAAARLSMSTGVATAANALSMPTALKIADAQLYAHKRRGLPPAIVLTPPAPKSPELPPAVGRH
jgi:diguanylate cyclase (GGDEF)-like protein